MKKRKNVKNIISLFIFLRIPFIENSFGVSDTGSLDHSESIERKSGKKGKREK